MDFTKDYLDIIKNDLSGLNLTRITEPKEFHEKQYLDSIIPFKVSGVLNLKESLHLDIGFGGGFPSLPLLYEFKSLNFKSIGLEARSKKVKAVNQIAKKLNLNNFIGLHMRLEDFLIDQKCIVTFKAVGKVSDFLSRINIQEKNIQVVFYKGPGLDQLEPGFEKIKNWKLIEKKNYSVGSNIRTFLVYEPLNLSKVNHKRLVKLSTIMSNK